MLALQHLVEFSWSWSV